MDKFIAKISKLEHRGEKHIKVDIPNAPIALTHIKAIEGRKFSRTHRCWYIPNTFAALASLKQYFEVQGLPTMKEKTVGTTPPKVITASDLPQSQFRTNQRDGNQHKVFTGAKIILEKEDNQWLRAFVPYDKKGWIEVLRNIPGRRWDSEGKFWKVPYVQDTFNRFRESIGAKHFELTFKVADNIPKAYAAAAKREKVKTSKYQLKDFQKKAITALEEKLLKEHKAWRTIKTYKGLFTHFVAYFPNIKPSKISKAQIEKYIVYKKQENASDSQMNQIINTLNCFYSRLLRQDEKIVKLERPKKKRRLPNVFSLEEIELLLKSCVNLKHKCMLILIYSGGLRRGEVLGLRIEDLNFERKTIFIKNAKGGKDRFTFFADIARKYIRDYIGQYKPTYYLFEGQTRGKYSESSLQAIYEKARQKARLNKFVTLHGLRHSFATHLVEKGIPLHVVQDLLGHGSIKTTEIYLHISNKFRKELKSPLDDMKL